NEVNLYIPGGDPVPGSGGAMHVTGAADVTLDRCVLTRNRAYGDGAGLWNDGSGHVRVVRSRFVRNLANYLAIGGFLDGPLDPVGRGGAIFHAGANIEIERTRFDSNRAVGETGIGGGIFNGG